MGFAGSTMKSMIGHAMHFWKTASYDNRSEHLYHLFAVIRLPKPFALGVGVSMSNVLVILVVFFPAPPPSAFSTSLSCCPGLGFLRGGSSNRTPVRRFWRFVLGRSAVERPVMRRDARRNDCRTSHCRFLASQKRTADPTKH